MIPIDVCIQLNERRSEAEGLAHAIEEMLLDEIVRHLTEDLGHQVAEGFWMDDGSRRLTFLDIPKKSFRDSDAGIKVLEIKEEVGKRYPFLSEIVTAFLPAEWPGRAPEGEVA